MNYYISRTLIFGIKDLYSHLERSSNCEQEPINKARRFEISKQDLLKIFELSDVVDQEFGMFPIKTVNGTKLLYVKDFDGNTCILSGKTEEELMDKFTNLLINY